VSQKFSSVVRILAVFGLFLAVPVIAFEQRFGGSPASQRGTNVQGQQTATARPAAEQRSGGQGQKPGQGPWEWWTDEAVKKELALSVRQVRDITKVFDERVRAMKPLSEEFEKQRRELEKMIEERVVDLSTYSIQVTRVEALRTELFKSRSVMFYAIYKMLTPEQYGKLREIRDRRERQRSGRGGSGSR
jgi:Spy/CpxP family protein refolding chaperone